MLLGLVSFKDKIPTLSGVKSFEFLIEIHRSKLYSRSPFQNNSSKCIRDKIKREKRNPLYLLNSVHNPEWPHWTRDTSQIGKLHSCDTPVYVFVITLVVKRLEFSFPHSPISCHWPKRGTLLFLHLLFHCFTLWCFRKPLMLPLSIVPMNREEVMDTRIEVLFT